MDVKEKIAQTVEDLKLLLLRKNDNYGCSAFVRPLLVPSVTAKQAILIRVGEKKGRE